VVPLVLASALSAFVAFEVIRTGSLAPLTTGTTLFACAVTLAAWLVFRVTILARLDRLVAAARALGDCEPPRADVTGFDELALLGETLRATGRELAAARARMIAGELRIRRVLDTVSEGICGLDHAGRCTFANRAAAQLLAIDEVDDLIGRDLHEMLAPITAEGRPLGVDELGFEGDGGARLVHDLLVLTADGRRLPIDLRINPVAGGPLSGRVISFVDASDRQAMQARLAQSDRMVSLGTLAAGIGHEINNPLTYIIAGVELASAPDTAPDDARAALADAAEGLARVRDIVRDLKLLSHGDRDAITPIDPVEALEGALRIANNVVRHRAEVERDLRPVPRVAGSATKLTQVFINLLINAAHAIGERAASRTIAVASRTSRDGRVILEVRDSGRGIPPELIGRIFDPFFTTKKVGEGTGLGLAISRSIVSAMGGEIRVASQVGVGTTFTVELPAVVELAAARPVAPPTPRADGRARVLVIDDDPAIGRALCRMLARSHEIRHVSSGRVALDELAAGAEVDVIVCDLMMPDMSGMEIAEALAVAAPGLRDRIVYMSGGAFTPEATAFVEALGEPVLDKPVDREALLARLADKVAFTAPGPAGRLPRCA
jgi:two-component system, cell cycle sensor histidine kinase and response regulator CckA